MKRLFLSSSASRSLHRLREFFFEIEEGAKVAFISNGADLLEDKSIINDDRDRLKDLGYNIVDIDLRELSNRELMQNLQDSEIIFVSGGNAFYLLWIAQQSGFYDIAKNLVEDGVIYVGSCAGSIIACPDISRYSTLHSREAAPELENSNGLGLVNFMIAPHKDNFLHAEDVEKFLKKNGDGAEIYALDDDEAIIIDGNNVNLIRG